MKRGRHLKFTQYFKFLTLNRGGGGIFEKSKGAMDPSPSTYVCQYLVKEIASRT